MMYRVAAVALGCVAAAVAQSHPVLPGGDIISRGFDMIGGAQNSSNSGSALLPVFELTYNKGLTTTIPGNPGLWSVADQMTVTNIDKSYQAICDKICMTYHDYIEEESSNFNIGVDVSIPIGVNSTKALSLSAKFSHEAYKYSQIMKQDTKASGFSKQYEVLYSVEALPPFLMSMSSPLSETVQALPTKIVSPQNQAMYNDVILYFGTHVAMMADYGGRYHLSTFVDDSIMSSHSEEWVANQLSLTLHYEMFNLSAGGFKNRSDIHIDQQFKEASETFIYFKGGNPALQSNVTARQWFESIPHFPAYLNTTLIGLDQVVQTVSEPKAQLLEKLLVSYMKTGKLPSTEPHMTAADYDYIYNPEPQQYLEDSRKFRNLRAHSA